MQYKKQPQHNCFLQDEIPHYPGDAAINTSFGTLYQPLQVFLWENTDWEGTDWMDVKLRGANLPDGLTCSYFFVPYGQEPDFSDLEIYQSAPIKHNILTIRIPESLSEVELDEEEGALYFDVVIAYGVIEKDDLANIANAP